ncbi:MAG: L-histidine N(alpha)-methyltransferase [Methanosarcina barkeri]|nr:L-histidine N(alpha)-methyltransferase [Methanosarcina sp. ERenArc_MAG2]
MKSTGKVGVGQVSENKEKIIITSKKDIEEKLRESLKNHELPDYLLYTGADGARNWLKLDESETFLVARKLKVLLEKNIASIVRFIPPGMSFVSIGVGNGEKERIFLEEIIRKNLAEEPASGKISIRYYPIDINNELVDIALEKVENLPVEKKGIVGFIEDMAILKKSGVFRSFSALWEIPFAITSQNSFFSLSAKILSRETFFLRCKSSPY